MKATVNNYTARIKLNYMTVLAGFDFDVNHLNVTLVGAVDEDTGIQLLPGVLSETIICDLVFNVLKEQFTVPQLIQKYGTGAWEA